MVGGHTISRFESRSLACNHGLLPSFDMAPQHQRKDVPINPFDSPTNDMTPLAWARLALGTVTIMPIRIVLALTVYVVWPLI